VTERLNAYLVALEAQSGTIELAQRSVRHLERLILEATTLMCPLTIGSTYGVRVDVNQPIADVLLPLGLEQLVCVVESAGRYVGSIQLPALNSVVASRTIAEAIVADLAWPLMLWYFRINLPRESYLKTRLSWLRQETRPLRIVLQLASLTWPLLYWQFREGILREPRLLSRLLRLTLEMRPLSIVLELIRTGAELRRNRVKDLLWDMARRLVREDGLLTMVGASTSSYKKC
jgi:hypothetical protein